MTTELGCLRPSVQTTPPHRIGVIDMPRFRQTFLLLNAATPAARSSKRALSCRCTRTMASQGNAFVCGNDILH